MTQHPNKSPGHQRNSKKRDKNGKKRDDSKPEDNDNNTPGTADAHVGEGTTPADSITPSNGFSIGAHILEVTKHKSWSAQSIKDLLGAHLMDDAI